MIKKIKSTDFERILRVALYLRLSKEDLDKLTPEERAESIKNQEIMLRAYAEDNGWIINDNVDSLAILINQLISDGISYNKRNLCRKVRIEIQV